MFTHFPLVISDYINQLVQLLSILLLIFSTYFSIPNCHTITANSTIILPCQWSNYTSYPGLINTSFLFSLYLVYTVPYIFHYYHILANLLKNMSYNMYYASYLLLPAFTCSYILIYYRG